MSTYEQLRGARLKFLDQDPANASNGQVWYNSATGKDRVQGIGSGAWSSSSPTIEVFSYASGSLQGTQTAAIIGAGGADPRSKSESYNGTGFSAEASLTNGRGNSEGGGGAGTATAALCFNGTPGGGPILNFIEEYNGTSWSEQSDLNTGRVQTGGAGTATAALCFAGQTSGGSTVHNETEEYNGTSWSEQNNLSTARRNTSGNGIQTSAISVGGVSGTTVYNTTEEYDGTSWTAGTNYPTNIRGASIIASTSSDAIVFGGNNPPSAIPAVGARQYDGTTWTALADLATTKQNSVGVGTTSTGIAIGGPGGAAISTSEEWNFSTTTITPAAWASGGSLNTARASLAGSGSSKDSALAFGGVTNRNQPNQANSNASETYDGTSWTEGNNLGTARQNLRGLGTVPAALVIGGYVSGAVGNVEEYDGTSWSEQNDLSTARWNVAQAGVQTAAVATTGSAPSLSNSTEEYDGTSWTAGTNFPETRTAAAGTGTSTAMAVLGGTNSSPSGPGTDTQIAEYDGSTWTIASGTLLTKRTGMTSNGPASLCLNSLGYDTTAYVSTSELYNGTTCVTQPSLAVSRSGAGGGNGSMPSTSAIVFGGSNNPTPGPADSSVEEFTGETTTPAPAQSLTTSS